MQRIIPSWIRSFATVMIIGSLAFVSPMAMAQDAATELVSLSGRIFQADGSTPYAQVTVRVMDQATGEEVGSTTTATDGSYSFETLNPGTYTFEVEVPDGVYQLDRAIEIGAGEKASISFTVKPTGAAGAVPPDAAQQGMSKKKKGTLIAIISAGAVLAAWLLLDDDDDPTNEASPALP